MSSETHLGYLDYAVIALSLAISMAIGIKFRFSGGRQKTTTEYLLAGKNMSKFPVVFSIVASMLSAIAMLGFPAEVYRYGADYATMAIALGIGMFLATYVILPVYFQCGITTIYEFLEMRFGKTIKYTVSAVFIIQTVMYMAAVLYSPALSLSAVTEISVETSIILCAGVCSIYCFIGGLKAVLWTDVFQALLMLACIISVYIIAITEVGGLSTMYERNLEGGRLHLANFSMDLTKRHTFWNILIQGLIYGMGGYGTNQITVQRLLSLSNCKRAQSAFLWSILPLVVLSLSCSLLGLVLYAVFYLCDPVINSEETGLSKYDQLLPFYIVTRLSSIPCLTGLCIAGIFSGSLSTVSSILNSLSAVTVTDFIQPILLPKRLSEKRLVFIAKVLALVYGAICIIFAFIISKTDSIMQIATVVLGSAEGPICAVFLLGVLTTKTSEKNALLGFLIGTMLAAWIGFGSLFLGHSTPTLPLSCNSTDSLSLYDTPVNDTNFSSLCYHWQNCSESYAESQNYLNEPFILYRVSFMWTPAIGLFSTVFFSSLSILVIGVNKQKNEINLKCLSPITRFWNPNMLFDGKSHQNNDTEMEVCKLTAPT